MVNGRRRVHQDTLREMEDSYPEIWRIEVPFSATVERMTTEKAPITHVKGGRRIAEQYRELWQRIAEELGFAARQSRVAADAEVPGDAGAQL